MSVLLLYLYAFYIIYLPDFSMFAPIPLYTVMTVIIAILNLFFLNLNLINRITKTGFWKIYIVYFFLLLWQVFLNLIYSFDISNFSATILFYFQTINFISLTIYFDRAKLNMKFVDFLIQIGLLQSLVIFLMLIFPQFKEIANLMYAQGEELSYISRHLITYRVYGLGSSHTFMLPLIQGLLAVLSLFMFDTKKNVRYLIYSFILIGSSIFNGRTALYIYIIVLAFFTVKWFFIKINLLRIFSFLIIVVLALILLVMVININPTFTNWFREGLTEIVLFLSGSERVGNVQVLTETQLFFPEGLNFILGNGMRVYGSQGQNNIGKSSDIGYVNDLFKGGTIYLIMMYITHFSYMFKNINNKFYWLLIVIYFLFANYKGEVMTDSALLMIVYSLIISNKVNKERENSNESFKYN